MTLDLLLSIPVLIALLIGIAIGASLAVVFGGKLRRD